MTTQATRMLLAAFGALATLAGACADGRDDPRASHADHARDQVQDGAGADDHKGVAGEGHDAPPAAGGGHDEHSQIKLSPAVLERIGIKSEEAQARALPTELSTTGEVDFDEDRIAHVSPRLSGRVAKVLKTLGDDVERGASLVVLDSIELGQAKAAYLQAKAAEDVARQALAREEELLKDRITSESVVLEARGRHLAAKSGLDAAAETLRLYGIGEKTIGELKYGDPAASSVAVRAPIAGRVVEKHVTRGELVTPDKSLFVVADLSSVWVWIDLFERDLPSVHVGDDIAVQTDSVPGRTFVGKIGYIRDQVDRDTRAVRARIDVDNKDRKLKPGMYANVRIADPHATDGHAEAASGLAVPTPAIVTDEGKTLVFVEKAPGTYERRVVRTGRRSASMTEVVEGLKPGERVVTEGTFYLKSEARKESLAEGGHAH